MNYEKVIDQFRTGDLEIDCRSMTLTQRVTGGEVYKGKGYIRQDEDGALQFKLYVVSTEDVKPFESFNRRLSVPLGKLHPEDVMYDLVAIAHDGTRWTSEKLLPAFSWDMKDVEAIAHGQCLSILSATSPIEKFPPFLQLHFFEEIDLPYSKASETEEFGERYFVTDKAEFEGFGCKWKVRKRDHRTVVEADSTGEALAPHFELRIQEAIQFVAAKPVFWRAMLGSNETKVEFELMSPWRRRVRTQMSLPISRAADGYFHKTWELFLKYLEYVTATTPDTQWSRIAYHLYNAAEATANSIDAWATGYCVSLEALTSFVELADDVERRARVLAYQGKVQDWLAKETDYPDLAERGRGMVSGLANERAKDKLHALEKTGHVTGAYIGSWGKLRNRQVHPRPADLMKPDANTNQQLLDLIHQVEVLLFQVVFYLVGYEGPFTDYGALQFPTIQYPLAVPAPKASEPA